MKLWNNEETDAMIKLLENLYISDFAQYENNNFSMAYIDEFKSEPETLVDIMNEINNNRDYVNDMAIVESDIFKDVCDYVNDIIEHSNDYIKHCIINDIVLEYAIAKKVVSELTTFNCFSKECDEIIYLNGINTEYFRDDYEYNRQLEMHKEFFNMHDYI